MTNNNEIRINWTMKNGWNAVVTVEHITTENINADGHVVAVRCNRIEKTLEIKEAGIVERSFYLTLNVSEKVKAAGAYGTIRTKKGIIGASANVCDEIMAAVEHFTPAKKEMVEEPKRGFGWCDNCQSYCYGDCGA